jgi:hypothetical protein
MMKANNGITRRVMCAREEGWNAVLPLGEERKLVCS